MPDEGLAKISGYVHVSKTSRLYESAVRTWILDDRINGEIEWTPDLPGKNGDWNLSGSNIRSSRASLLPVMAAPDASRTGWATALWVNRGGRSAKASQAADGEGSAAAADSAAARPHGRQCRPPPVP